MTQAFKDIKRPESVFLKKGEVLFSKGDEGGTVYLIKSGEVQIYTTSEGKDIALKTMKQGEVLGTASCLTGSPRIASAKALAPAELSQYTAHQLQAKMTELPGWVGVVVKDITLIIGDMNAKYTQAIERIDAITRKGLTAKQKAHLVTNTIGTLTPRLGRDIDDKKAMYYEDLMPIVAEIIGQNEEDLQPIVDILLEAGLIKLTIDPERKKKYLSAEYAKKNLLFAQFLRESEYGANKKLVEAQLTPKQKRMITALVRYAKSTGSSLGKPVKFGEDQLAGQLKPKTTVSYHKETIVTLGELSLFEVEIKRDLLTIAFVPAKVSRMMAFVDAYHKINALEVPEQQLKAS